MSNQHRSTPTSARYSRVESYAAIGDGRTVALISTTGSIDWLPIPALGSLPAFAAILDPERGGHVALRPVGEYSSTRRYIPGTNVLETTYTAESGSATVTDAMITGVAGRLPWAQLVRRIEGVNGSIDFHWSVCPGTSLNTISPWFDTVDGVQVIRQGTTMVAVIGVDHFPEEPELGRAGTPGSVAGAFTTTRGSRHVVALTATDSEPLHIPAPDRLWDSVDTTIANWRAWSDSVAVDGPWADQVRRSALALKLLIYAPTGAVAAAATTSLPESPAGGKNWDYRFAWVRDLAYTIHSLGRLELREEIHAGLSWLLRTIREHGPGLRVFYTLDGHLPEAVEEHDAPGWRGIGPVVTGNPAAGQLQLGVFGDLSTIVHLYVGAGNILDVDTSRQLARTADYVCDTWRSADSGMWELPELRHYTSSKMGCWLALDRAADLAERGQIPGSASRWRAERDAISEWVRDHCWDEDRSTYLMYPGSEELDTSVLLHARSGFDSGPRMSSTIDALRSELGRGDLIYRYTGADEEEHTFVACAFWTASALAAVGRAAEADELMANLVERANDVGLYSEMISEDGAFWGNHPQGLSHLALIGAALSLGEHSEPQI